MNLGMIQKSTVKYVPCNVWNPCISEPASCAAMLFAMFTETYGDSEHFSLASKSATAYITRKNL